MSSLFFFMSVLFGLAAIHPFITYPVSLMILEKFKRAPLRPAKDAPAETYAICMCAYNEETVIADKAENLLALKRAHPELEVRIYVDCASDNTAEILQDYKDDFHIHVATERHGKSHGMNLLVSQTQASIILFTDANVMLDSNAVSSLEKYFADPTVGCVCGNLQYTNADSGATAATGSLYWQIEEAIKDAESETGSVMGADGSIFAIRRALHNPPPDDIIDDMYVSFSILCDGYRIVRAPDVIAYEESVTDSREEFNRKVRIACQAFNGHRLLWPRLKMLGTLNLYKYVSHKLLRWFTLPWIVLSASFFLFFLFAEGWVGFAIFLTIMIGGGLYTGNLLKMRPIPELIDIFSSFAGTALGVYKSFKGERYQTWKPAQSIRKNAS